MINIEPVSEKTFKKVIDMKLPDEQNKFVAPNVVSLAQAWLYYDEARPFAICDDDEVVGFVMLDWDEDERCAGVWRFMIAYEMQRRGYGRKAMEAVIKLIKDTGKFDAIYLDYVPGNTSARELYYSLGFRETGKVEEDEIIMRLPLTCSPKVGMLTADSDDISDFIELIDKEKQAGTPIPAQMADKAELEKAVREKRVKRFTVIGETIGLSIDGELLIESGSKYLQEARAKLK